MKVNNAIILAAGTASRFAPLSYEKHKALIEVKGEILIERQIKQLRDAGIEDIIVVTGYKSEQFEYLKEKFGVKLKYNSEYLNRNNNSSIYVVKDYLKNSYICSSDNYFIDNPFESEVDDSYYSAIYAKGQTKEWCIFEKNGIIIDVAIGGHDSWIMMGQAFWSETFSKSFVSILEEEYDKEETKNKLWETIYIEHINKLPMEIKKYEADSVFEFDTLDELREFDDSYVVNTRSSILKQLAFMLGIEEHEITNVESFKDMNNEAVGFTFDAHKKYKYYYKTAKMEVVE